MLRKLSQRSRLLTGNTESSGLLQSEKLNQNKSLVGCLAFSILIGIASYTIVAPFFPHAARLREISSTVAGCVLAVHSLVQFLSAPVFGKLIPMFGAKRVFTVGCLCCSLFSMVFGCIDLLPLEHTDVFVGLCLTLRCIVALGTTAILTSAFAIATSTFRENPSTVIGILETSLGAGMMLGPVVGGLLYGAGGFPLPFTAMGFAFIALLLVSACVLPAHDDSDKSEEASVLQLLNMELS